MGQYKRKTNWMATILFLLVFICLGYVLTNSTLFQVNIITVEGVQHLTAEEIQLASGITNGTNIFSTNLKAAQGKIEDLCRVKTASLERRFPDQIFIEVQERKPVALMEIENEIWEIDEEAVPVQTYEGSSNSLPHIAGPGIQNPALPEVLEALSLLPESLLQDLSGIYVDANLDLTATLVPQTEIHFGPADNLEEKSAVLLEIINYSQQEELKLEYIEISDPNEAVIKYVEGPRVFD